MTKESREEQFWKIFTDEGITPIVFDPNDPVSTERGMKELTERMVEAVNEIDAKDKPKS